MGTTGEDEMMVITQKDIDAIVGGTTPHWRTAEILTNLLERIEKLEAGWRVGNKPTEHGWYDVVLDDGTERLLALSFRGWIIPDNMDGPLLSTSPVTEFDGVVKRWRKR